MEPRIVIRRRIIDSIELNRINEVVGRYWDRGRTFISQELCRIWDWRQPNGIYKEQVCRILLNKLERKALIQLPPRRGGTTSGNRRYYVEPDEPPCYSKKPITGKLKAFLPVQLKMVRRCPEEELWNYLVYRYHYKSYKIIVGSHLKYLALINDTPIACLSWSSSIFRIRSRDDFLGWSQETKNDKIHFVANNSRFLILPWIRIKNLASHLLALCARTVSKDWQKFYGHPLYLLETFVETDRFRGTCYQAANWIKVGQTSGHAKTKGRFYYHGHKKDVYLYPLVPDFRKRLSTSTGEM